MATLRQNESTIGSARSGARPLANECDRVLDLRYHESADYRLVSVPEMEPSERERVAATPETPLEDASAKIVKQGRSALIVRPPCVRRIVKSGLPTSVVEARPGFGVWLEDCNQPARFGIFISGIAC